MTHECYVATHSPHGEISDRKTGKSVVGPYARTQSREHHGAKALSRVAQIGWCVALGPAEEERRRRARADGLTRIVA